MVLLCSNKHSSFSTTFPIYLFTQYEDEVPVEDEESPVPEESEAVKPESDEDDDEAVIEEVSDEEPEAEKKEKKTKKVIVDEWMHLNSMPPVWLR